ncbi:MAG: hypothetical protein JRI23_27210 [Deltaproteobacteria bacterium]|jgi:hypothetical protein|nr:hypothetical protein [Deltaproteobacteria bacterium]MBW2535771.1 hypothetical protein [Deltaproteobacteria bacterium]
MFIARWDLDKTYLRTEFDSVGALIRTAFERPDQKRTVPGAAELMRQFADADIAIHILSGSPEQLRSRIVAKLRLDGVAYASLTLKPNLQNLLRLRFKALRGQLGYKLPTLLQRRCELPSQRDPTGELVGEALLGDDAEADALVYSLYADVCAGRIDDSRLTAILRAGGVYDDVIADTVRFASYVEPGPVVERILIHLERQSSPSDFDGFGGRVVPFYNYLQAAFVLHDIGRLPGQGVLGVARDLATREHFDGGTLARSYLDLARRGHVTGRGVDSLAEAYAELVRRRPHQSSELGEMVRRIERARADLPAPPPPRSLELDYERLVQRRWRRKS